MVTSARQRRASQVEAMEVAVKKTLLVVLLSLTVILALPLGAFAGVNPVLPGGGWWTGSRIQNVGTSTATVDMTAYHSASSSTYPATKPIRAGRGGCCFSGGV